MMSGALGLGVLGLPHALQQAGLLIGIFFLVLGGFLTYWTLNCLMDAGFKHEAVNYSDLIYKRMLVMLYRSSL